MGFNHEDTALSPIHEHIWSIDPEIMLMDGFDDAIIGLTQRMNEPNIAVYSWEKIIEILINRDGLDIEEAIEHTEYNILGAWMGDRTPIVVMPIE